MITAFFPCRLCVLPLCVLPPWLRLSALLVSLCIGRNEERKYKEKKGILGEELGEGLNFFRYGEIKTPHPNPLPPGEGVTIQKPAPMVECPYRQS